MAALVRFSGRGIRSSVGGLRSMRPALFASSLAAGISFLAGSCDREPSSAVPAGPAPAEEFRAIAEELYAGRCPQYGRAPREELEQELAESGLPNGKRLQLQL